MLYGNFGLNQTIWNIGIVEFHLRSASSTNITFLSFGFREVIEVELFGTRWETNVIDRPIEHIPIFDHELGNERSSTLGNHHMATQDDPQHLYGFDSGESECENDADLQSPSGCQFQNTRIETKSTLPYLRRAMALKEQELLRAIAQGPLGQSDQQSSRKDTHGKRPLLHQLHQVKGADWSRWGEALETIQTSDAARNSQTLKKMEIRELILSGTRRTVLIARFPHLVPQIGKLMELRPPRIHQTYWLYLWGPTGIGKTTAVLQTLATLSKLYPKLSFYNKSGGLTKHFDGYDNQPIVWMDDPCPIAQRTNETATVRKNVAGSSGPCQLEIKFGAMQFDSHLIIITTNTPPDLMAMEFWTLWSYCKNCQEKVAH